LATRWPIVAAIVEHELAVNRGITQADESRRRGVVMDAIAGVDIAVRGINTQALGILL